jgi:hypothetical protein
MKKKCKEACNKFLVKKVSSEYEAGHCDAAIAIKQAIQAIPTVEESK